MAKEKEVAEHAEKEAPVAVDDTAERPKKQDGPQRAPLAALQTAKGPGPAAERARAVTTMQREIGNARVANALAGAEAAAQPEKPLAAAKKAMPETGNANAADAETRERTKQP